jgi:beta-glucosidase/6-phospho-beta-glucosidase/beta-galactosidase
MSPTVAKHPAASRQSGTATEQKFMFATGIECSYPVITGPDGKDLRVDELEKTRHYEHWKEDFGLVRDLGLEFLRYGPPYYRVHQGADRYDWSFVDQTFGELKRLQITPIADLCHFGVPDWIGGFQNTDWPELYADYARAFAERYDWVQMFTPVNEIYVAAIFSAEKGWWNERLSNDHAFVRALSNLVKATLLAEEAILEVRPNALFIQSESTQYFHSKQPSAEAKAEFLNTRRFLAADLCYGHDVPAMMHELLLDNGMSRADYQWFMDHGAAIKPHCILGTDYYARNEHMVESEDGASGPSGEILGYYVISNQYFERYHLPVMHTETNTLNDEKKAPDWLHKEWANMQRLRKDGIPIIGFTWYSLIDQVDWDTSLRENNGRVNPCGLYDLDRQIRSVGKEYRELVNKWRDILHTESLAFKLSMPLAS